MYQLHSFASYFQYPGIARLSTTSVIMEGLVSPEGCYLVFESTSGGRLMLIYSKSVIPKNAIGFWYVGKHKDGIVGTLLVLWLSHACIV